MVTQAEPDAAMATADIVLGPAAAGKRAGGRKAQWFQITSAGYTRYDSPEFRQAAKARGLIVTNSSAVYDQPCAEQALAFLLAQARQLPASLKSG